MAAYAKGASVLLLDSMKTTPYKQASITGMSFSVELRTLQLRIFRYDEKDGYLPLNNYPVRLNLITSNQQDQLVTGPDGTARAFFPDADISVALEPTAAPPAHQAVLNYSIRTNKRNELTIIFIPDSLRRFYTKITLF